MSPLASFEAVAEWRTFLKYQYRKYITKFWNEVFTKKVILATMFIVSIDKR